MNNIPWEADASLLQSWSGACLIRGSLQDAVRHYMTLPVAERIRVDRLKCARPLRFEGAVKDQLLPFEIRRLAEMMPEGRA